MSTAPLGFLPPLDEIAYAVNLAEGRASHPFERILQSLPESQRRLAMIDNAAAAQILSAYDGAREDIVARMDRRWERVLAESGGSPSEGQLYSFAHDTELLQSLEARQLEVTDRAVSIVEGAHESAIQEAMRHAGFERSQIARGLDPEARMAIAGSFAPPPGVAEEIGIPRAVARIRAAGGELNVRATETLARAAMSGEGVGPMKSRLRKEFDLTARSAELTSRYVTISSYNYAREMHYIGLSDQLAQYGRKLQKMWLTSVDDRTCPICLALHGQVVDTEESFPLDATYGTTAPGKPYPDPNSCEAPPRHARCRCSITSWVEGWRDGTSRTPEALQEEAREWAEKAGLKAPAATPPVTGEALKSGPSPFSLAPNAPRRISGAALRQIGNVDFNRALTVYRMCSIPDR